MKFNIGDKQFSVRKLDAIKQFHICRRIGPLLADLMPIIQKMHRDAKKFESLSEDEKLDSLAPLFKPIMNGFAKLSDEDANYVLNGLLSVVEYQQPETGGWATVYANGQMMVNNLELPVLMNAAGRAFMHNLSGFFSAPPQ